MLSRAQKQLNFEPLADLAQVESRTLDELQRNLRFVANTVTAILDGLPIQRRPLSEATKALHVEVTWLRRNGLCPCCQCEPVCGPEERLPGSEFDHWYGRSRNRPEESWLVCRACNQQLETTSFKGNARSTFEAYQQALEQFLEQPRGPLLFDEIV